MFFLTDFHDVIAVSSACIGLARLVKGAKAGTWIAEVVARLFKKTSSDEFSSSLEFYTYTR